jgi:16S rRNA (uracil1498-N3)-methyltransferase
MGDWLKASPRFGPAGVAIAIGPEGGFSDEETAAATAADWQLLDLGERILRIETAATLLTALTIAADAARI